MSEEETTRLIVNLTPKTAAALNETALLTEFTRTDVVNRAIQLYCWWEKVSARGGDHFFREDGRGKARCVKLDTFEDIGWIGSGHD